jgi:hypothetical protein
LSAQIFQAKKQSFIFEFSSSDVPIGIGIVGEVVYGDDDTKELLVKIFP